MLQIMDAKQFQNWKATSVGQKWFNFDQWHSVILSDSVIEKNAQSMMVWVSEYINYPVIATENIVTIQPSQDEIDEYNAKQEKILTEARNKSASHQIDQLHEQLAQLEKSYTCHIGKLRHIEHQQSQKEQKWTVEKNKQTFFDRVRGLSTPECTRIQTEIDKLITKWHDQKRRTDQAKMELEEFQKTFKRTEDNLWELRYQESFMMNHALNMIKPPTTKHERRGWIVYFADATHAMNFKLTWSSSDV